MGIVVGSEGDRIGGLNGNLGSLGEELARGLDGSGGVTGMSALGFAGSGGVAGVPEGSALGLAGRGGVAGS